MVFCFSGYRSRFIGLIDSNIQNIAEDLDIWTFFEENF